MSGYHSAPKTKDMMLASAWNSMMQRRYNSKHIQHKDYGAKRISVCKRWHQVGNYIKDVKHLYGWESKDKDWSGTALDKDYYSSNQYSPDTCVWLSVKDNNTYMDRVVPVIVTCGQGKTHVYLSVADAAKATAVGQATVHSWLTGSRHQTIHLDLKFEYYITKHPLRRQLIRRDGGAGRSNNKVS